MIEKALLLSVVLRVPEAATPNEDPAAAADAVVDAAPGDEADADTLDPAFAAIFTALPASAQTKLAALDEADIAALVERSDKGEPLDADEQAIVGALVAASVQRFDAELGYRNGDISLSDGLATLHLGEGYRFLGPDDARRVLVDAWGNPPSEIAPLGMIVPAETSPLSDEGWGVIVTFAADGYVDDDDADDIDYDDLLREMKAATEAENEGRVTAGYPPLHLVGWAEPPHYDAAHHRLYWAKELASDGATEHSLNYAIRVLGRRGVLELNAVAGLSQLANIKPAMEGVLTLVEFDAGHRYEDFDPKLDQVAAYGIGGLIAGKVLAKAGIFAVLLKFVAVGWKAILAGLVALGAVVRGLFKRRE